MAAIIAFIVVAGGWLLGLGGGDSPGLSNLSTAGGFAPDGVLTLMSGVVMVVFAFVGAEIVTIAAAESGESEEAVAGAVRSVVYRVLIFYVLSVLLLVAVVPWNQVTAGDSPFISALDRVGIPGSADAMNAIIVTAVLSCLNSGLYTGSRTVRAGPARRRAQGPARREPPRRARQGDPADHRDRVPVDDPRQPSPDTVFLFLVNSSGAVALFVYLLIAIAELRMRGRLEREAPERLKVKMWLYPWLTWVSIVATVAVIVSMALVDDEATNSYLVPSLISLAVVLAAAFLKGRLEQGRGRVPAPRRGGVLRA